MWFVLWIWEIKTMKIKSTIMKNNSLPRFAFTLVELLVSMALILIMLSIMSQAFVIATTTMQGLRDAVGMQEKVRPVLALLQRDLGAYHFEGSRKLSDPDFWKNGPPDQGYFMVWQESPYDSFEGTTVEGNDGVKFSRSASLANHMLAFSVKLSGNSPEELFKTQIPISLVSIPIFSKTIPTSPTDYVGITQQQALNDYNVKRYQSDPSTMNSRWGEVAYFLGAQPNPPAVASTALPAPQSTGQTQAGQYSNPLNLFTLYRQTKTLLPSNPAINPINPIAPSPYKQFPSVSDSLANRELLHEFSVHPENIPASPPNPRLIFNSPEDLTIPFKRMGNRRMDYLGFPNQPTGPIRLNPLFQDYENVGASIAGTPDHLGAFTDIIATDVISFDVKLLTDSRTDFENLYEIANQNNNNINNSLAPPSSVNTIFQPYLSHNPINNYGSYTPFINNNRFVFDTWTKDQGASGIIGYSRPIFDPGFIDAFSGRWRPSTRQVSSNPDRFDVNTGVPIDRQRVIPFWNNQTNNGLSIRAIQISLRLWDVKTNTARQYIIVQKL